MKKPSTTRHARPTTGLAILLLACSAAAAHQLPIGIHLSIAATTFAADEIVLREGLVITSVSRYGRSPVHQDAIESLIVAGRWSIPKAGDSVSLPNGSVRTWEPITAAEDGIFNHRGLASGYLYCAVHSQERAVMILEAAGHGMVYVNGEPRMGDPYRHGYVGVPIELRKGTNDFLFQGGRGPIQAKLVPPRSSVQFELADTTVPDLIIGSPVEFDASVVVVNSCVEWAEGLAIEATVPESASHVSELPAIPPLGVRKVAFRLVATVPNAPGDCDVDLKLLARTANAAATTLDTATLKLKIVSPADTHKRTFRSTIDGSVQYYAVVPQKHQVTLEGVSDAKQQTQKESISPATDRQSQRPSLILTLHGAGVEAFGQAVCYSSKPGVVTVAPTNRRPFGFDWEDWGRQDAIEVLDLAQEQFGTDPRRTYLTGHSMGGHGVWHIGVTFPDRFAAIGPSAGWVSMFSYAGARRTTRPDAEPAQARIATLLNRCMAPSDTLALARNYLQHGVYVLHGEMDDNVPVSQARTMKQQLEGMHNDFDYYEEPGAGHWWGKDLSPYAQDGATWGTACVDWPPMFHFFVRHCTPARADVRHIEFTTASPGVSARSHWATIEAQNVQLEPSSLNLDYEPTDRRFVGKTANVARLSIDVRHLPADKSICIELDGQILPEVAWPEAGCVWLSRLSDRWSVSPRPATSLKGPQRYGTFKDAVRNRVLFVYGTRGTDQENAWALTKARYDAEQFWYRGNGSIDLISDMDFAKGSEKNPAMFADRNVMLYGNSETNTAWSVLLPDCPVQVRRGRVAVGDHEELGDDLACLFIRPRPNSETASVGVVSGTSLVGMRLTERIPYFTSGVAFPDVTVIGSDMLADSMSGVRVAGFFGFDWRVDSGEFATNQ